MNNYSKPGLFTTYPQKPNENLNPNQKVILYLWISHGSNATVRLTHYPIETKLYNVSLMSENYQSYFSDNIGKIIELNNESDFNLGATKLLYGACSYVSVPIPCDNNHTRRKIYLPHCFLVAKLIITK